MVDSTVRDRHEPRPIALLEATDPYNPFDHSGWTSNTLARATQENKPFAEALEVILHRSGPRCSTPRLRSGCTSS